jgi:transcriptional regulator with XRE-family HTH domain
MQNNYDGYRLYKLRTMMGLSQGELGDLIDIWPQNISGWEHGTRKPGMLACSKLIELAKKYDIDVGYDFLRPDLVR